VGGERLGLRRTSSTSRAGPGGLGAGGDCGRSHGSRGIRGLRRIHRFHRLPCPAIRAGALTGILLPAVGRDRLAGRPAAGTTDRPEREVLRCLLNAAEPTWIVLSAADVQMDRARAEAVLSDLENQSLVYSVLEDGGEPGKESELDRWWGITDECWDILGMIKSPTYW
jgi:hypothetical protein